MHFAEILGLKSKQKNKYLLFFDFFESHLRREMMALNLYKL